MIKTFDEMCKWLKNNEFRRVSVNGPNNWIYNNKDNTLSITVEEHYEDKLSAEDEERIKKRLVELGYL